METSEDTYTPAVGDRVTFTAWFAGWYLDVKFVGDTYLCGDNQDGEERFYLIETPSALRGRYWLRVEKPIPFPERWINVYPGSLGVTRRSRESALDGGDSDIRLAIIHVCPDRTVEVLNPDGSPQ